MLNLIICANVSSTSVSIQAIWLDPGKTPQLRTLWALFYFPIFVAQSTCIKTKCLVGYIRLRGGGGPKTRLLHSQHESINSTFTFSLFKNQGHTTKLRKNNLFTRKCCILENKQNNFTLASKLKQGSSKTSSLSMLQLCKNVTAESCYRELRKALTFLLSTGPIFRIKLFSTNWCLKKKEK